MYQNTSMTTNDRGSHSQPSRPAPHAHADVHPIGGSPDSNASRAHVHRSGRFIVEKSVEDVFPLFTALGEKLWVAGWNPEIHFPDDGAPRAGAVFSTRGDDGLRTHWVLVDWEPERHRARYARITPERRAGTVEVSCRGLGGEATEVEVTYDLVALSPTGDEDLAAWTEPWYASYLEEWRKLIAAYFAALGEDRESGT